MGVVYETIQNGVCISRIADDDMPSKIVFSILQLLKAIAESTQDQSAPVLTIPTR